MWFLRDVDITHYRCDRKDNSAKQWLKMPLGGDCQFTSLRKGGKGGRKEKKENNLCSDGKRNNSNLDSNISFRGNFSMEMKMGWMMCTSLGGVFPSLHLVDALAKWTRVQQTWSLIRKTHHEVPISTAAPPTKVQYDRIKVPRHIRRTMDEWMDEMDEHTWKEQPKEK